MSSSQSMDASRIGTTTTATAAAATTAPTHNPATLKKTNASWRDALAGAGAGAASRTAMAPLERLKLLKQLQYSSTNQHQAAAALARQQSTWQIFQWVLKEQGLRSFWRGNTPAVIRVSGTAAINFTALAYYKQQVVGPLLQYYSGGAQSQRRNQFLGSLLAGGLAGATSTTLMYPFEFARTRLAMDMGKDSEPKAATTKVENNLSTKTATTTTTKTTTRNATTTKPTARQYRGMTDVVYQIVKTDGPLGLYRGYGIALVGGIFYRVLYLGGYDAVKNEYYNQKQGKDVSFLERFAIAQGIALTAGTLSYPFDSVRRRMMMQAGLLPAVRHGSNKAAAGAVHYRNSLHCIQVMWQTEGIRGFFLGLGPNVLRSVGGALLLVAYDTFRSML